MLETPNFSLQSGGFTQTSGSTNCIGLLKVWNSGWFTLGGGELYTSATILGDTNLPTGVFTQTGGVHKADSLTVGYYTSYSLQAGVLSAGIIRLAPSGELRLLGGALVGGPSVVLANGRLTASGARQFGPLTLGNGLFSQISFMPETETALQFQDSHETVWDPNSRLILLNWGGTLTGGGTHRMYVGSNAQGLTAGQLQCIVFAAPDGGFYVSRLLPTGEIVPAPSPAPTLMHSNGQLLISWPASYGLYSSTNLNGPYYFVSSGSPFTNWLLSPQEFFVLRLPW